MKFNPHTLFPPAIVIEDESVIYRRMLRENEKRQSERDMMAIALLENMHHGLEYVSMFEAFPELFTTTDRAKILEELTKLRPSKYDASKAR